MRCPPCHNPMNVAEFVDLSEGALLGWMKGWQCDRCGYSVNPLAEHNRRFTDMSKAKEATQECVKREEVASYPGP